MKTQRHYKVLIIISLTLKAIKKPHPFEMRLWSHLGSNQGPPDYESGALTN
jgi:hypothetical protein